VNAFKRLEGEAYLNRLPGKYRRNEEDNIAVLYFGF